MSEPIISKDLIGRQSEEVLIEVEQKGGAKVTVPANTSPQNN